MKRVSSPTNPWTPSTVRMVLTNEKYSGNNVYNRSSFKLKKAHVDNPPEMWVRKEGAFEEIVPLEFFLTAQEIITARSVFGRRAAGTSETPLCRD